MHASALTHTHLFNIHASTTRIERGTIDFNSIHCELPECKFCRFSHNHETHS